MTSNKSYISTFILLFFSIGFVLGQSPLSQGDIYKLEITEDGIYKIDASLMSEMGIDINSLNANQLFLYGFGEGMLPQTNSDYRPDELLEVPMKYVGNDTNLNSNSYFLFYGFGPNKTIINSDEEFVNKELNLYSATNNYFLVVKSQGSPKRIQNRNVSGINSQNFDQLIESIHFEEDIRTALNDASGRFFFGENFTTTTSKSISIPVIPQSTASLIRFKIGVMGKSREVSTFSIQTNTVNRGELEVPAAPEFNSYRYGNQGHMVNSLFDPYSVNSIGDNITFDISFSKPLSDSEGYLDYITLNINRTLMEKSGGFSLHGFFDNDSRDVAAIKNSSNLEIWDISNTQDIYVLPKVNDRNNLSRSKSYFEVVAFNNSNVLSPTYLEKIPNQNLRGISVPNLLIITAPQYLTQANQLKSHRESHDNLSVSVVTTDQVYNEFSSGRQDVSAIRDFAKYLYEKNNQELKYLLLFGQGSYDYKGSQFENSSQVPVYESRNVLHRTQTFSSEDYFGFFDNHEGYWTEDIEGTADEYDLEIGIGRLPARNVEQAQLLLNKLISYDTTTANRQQWKKDIVFVADDGDNNNHQSDANELAVYVEETFKEFNSKRIYIDNLQKETSPTGAIAPETYDLVYKTINDDGAMIINYSGHGSISRWADETIMDLELANNLTNYHHLPLFFTATCEYGRYDNPNYESGAEQLLFNSKGGAIALMTTTRPVFASSNLVINKAFYEQIFVKDADGNYPRLGDVFKLTKNNSLRGTRNRNFALLGDPSMRLFIPKTETKITHLNDELLSSSDTIKALDRIRLRGEIVNDNTRNTGFNGEVFLTLFEKPITSSTLGNDGPETVFEYQERKYQLFRGVADVVNGEFEIDFVVPLDIRYNIGNAKFSLYAKANDNEEAIGGEMNILIGGSSDNPVQDNNPPEISISLNGDPSNVNTYPDLYFHAELEDESGINISGIGVGHDATLILDEGDTSWVVNDYIMPVSGQENTYSLVFPVNNLEEGEHTLELVVWDVLNNRSSKTIRFYVSNINEIEVEELKAYPNPVNNQFTLSFKHNLGGKYLKIQSNIVDMSGKVVLKSDLEYEVSDDIIQIQYDDVKSSLNLNKGIYVIQLIIESPILGLQSVKTIRIVVI
ncbi:type IX secretion system sortase PorU [Flammeovirga sp. MY04]|uniref:type IX secretion system sortase PorU n=1 Tax=Flammeovirga sp. MY04 TaxID=1191459 RepID=UPI000806162F|nr:type IX secretion system sortase PorU [Flammeovirga sp. MY04]ANQ51016.1 type IX secretion system sortase PorU [Flammeovirga sp. MY04]